MKIKQNVFKFKEIHYNNIDINKNIYLKNHNVITINTLLKNKCLVINCFTFEFVTIKIPKNISLL